jgi:hypothetical protein
MLERAKLRSVMFGDPKLQFRTSNLCILATSLLLTVRGVRFGQIRKGATQAVVG